MQITSITWLLEVKEMILEKEKKGGKLEGEKCSAKTITAFECFI